MTGPISPPTGAWWLTRRAEDVAEGTDWLTAPEREVLEGLEFPKRRADWLLGRWTAKAAVATYLGLRGRQVPASNIEVRAAADGAPEAYRRGDPLPVRLSLSQIGRAHV